MKVDCRPYRCVSCGHQKSISTNHEGPCYAHCEGCSWKALAFPGVHMFGTWHRAFEFAGQGEEKSAD